MPSALERQEGLATGVATLARCEFEEFAGNCRRSGDTVRKCIHGKCNDSANIRAHGECVWCGDVKGQAKALLSGNHRWTLTSRRASKK